MKCRPEHIILFFASVRGHDEYILSRINEFFADGLDWNYLEQTAVAFGVAGGLIGRLHQTEIHNENFIERIRNGVVNEIQKTESMISLYKEISALLVKNGFSYIPLKGSDIRISQGSRRIFNPMDDIDVLIRNSDIEDVGKMLEGSGYHYQGTFSGSHMNFFTDEATPRFIEIHWDVINRHNPIHGRLFKPSIDAIWERSISRDGETLMSEEDLVSYLAAHCFKEYFHKPKWLADMAWIIENCSCFKDAVSSRKVICEWGTSHALGIIAASLNILLRDSKFDSVFESGACRPGIVGRYVAKRLVCYEQLRLLRPLFFVTCADSFKRKIAVTAGIAERYVRRP